MSEKALPPGETSPLGQGLTALRQATTRATAAASADDRDSILNDLKSEPKINDIITSAMMSPAAVSAELERLSGVVGFSGRGKELQEFITEKLQQAQIISSPSGSRQLEDLLPPRAALRLDKQTQRLQLPNGYTISNSQVRKTNALTGTSKLVSQCPIIITASTVNESGARDLTVSWWESQGRGLWYHLTVPRHHLLDTRQILQWAYYGLPVSTATAKDLTTFLSAFEMANAGNIPRGELLQSLGWYPRSTDPNDFRAFVLPNEIIGDAPGVRFTVLKGYGEFISSIHSKGSMREWLKLFEIAQHYPLSYMPLYASIASILLPVLGVRCFTLDLAESTGAGKTTALQLGFSAWGKPTVGDGLIRSWDDKTVFSELAAGILGNLPLGNDETKRAKSAEDVASFVYEWWQGIGRGRGLPERGSQETSRWHSVLMSTGEGPITGLSAGMTDRHGGLRARVVEIRGRPMGLECDKNRDAAETIEKILLANYGHLGPAVVELLVEGGEEAWDYLKERYEENLKQLRSHESVKHSSIAGRVTAYLAVMQTAAELIHDNFDVPPPMLDPFSFALDSAVGGGDPRPRHARTILRLRQWLVSNSQRFYGRHDVYASGPQKGQPLIPKGGWAGIWKGHSDWSHVMILDDAINQLFYRWRVNRDETVREWMLAGYVTDAFGQQVTEADAVSGVIIDPICMVSLRGLSVPCLRFTRKAIEGQL